MHVVGLCRLGQKGVDTASDTPVPVPGDVHMQDTGMDSTTVASIVAGKVITRLRTKSSMNTLYKRMRHAIGTAAKKCPPIYLTCV